MIAMAAALFCMVSVGLTIAHFRDALTAELAEPAQAAWSALRASPFDLRDVELLAPSCDQRGVRHRGPLRRPVFR